MPHVFTDSPDKRIVRLLWNTPLLKYLNREYGFIYRYFGLPGPDIIDIKLWKDMISEVIAFEVPAEGKPDERLYITRLRENLELVGIPNIAYYGPFEEVVLLGKDYEGQEYAQRDVITLYNLDFCSEIGSKIRASSGEQCYRVEAIRQIIRDQVECFNGLGRPSCFIIFLTVRNQIHSRVLRERLEACMPFHEEFIRECTINSPIPPEEDFLIGSHTWALKTIILTILKESLRGNNISALFFPFVKYMGKPIRIDKNNLIASPMLNLMIFCKFQHPREMAGVSMPADPLRIKALSVNGADIVLAPEVGETLDGSLSAVEFFERYRTMIIRNNECLVG
jgi:hypothetical protein